MTKLIKCTGLRTLRRLLSVFLLALLVTNDIGAQELAVVSSNLPETVTTEITVGMVQANIEFEVQEVDSIIVTAIVPVAGATFSLLDPNSQVVVDHSSAEFTDGADYSPALPGGVFATGEIDNPAPGTWTIRLDFMAASEKTVILASIGKKSRYQVGIVLARNHVNTGEDVPFGIIVLDNGTPITSLGPEFSVEQDGVEIAAGISGKDDGVNMDGLADDGIYSAEYVFAAEGIYEIHGLVEIPTGSGLMRRRVSASVEVSNPGLTVSMIENILNLDPSGCIESFDVRLSVEVSEASAFAAKSVLRSPTNDTLQSVAEVPAGIGPQTADLIFPVNDIREILGSSDPYEVISVEIINTEDTPKLVFLSETNDPFVGVSVNDFCVAPVVIDPEFVEVPVFLGGSNSIIAALDFMFKISVKTPGTYSISFKILGPNGEDLGLSVESRSLIAGENTVVVRVDASVFADIDGPYTVIAFIVSGTGGAAQVSSFRSTQFYSGSSFVGATPILEPVPVPALEIWGLLLLIMLMGAIVPIVISRRIIK